MKSVKYICDYCDNEIEEGDTMYVVRRAVLVDGVPVEEKEEEHICEDCYQMFHQGLEKPIQKKDPKRFWKEQVNNYEDAKFLVRECLDGDSDFEAAADIYTGLRFSESDELARRECAYCRGVLLALKRTGMISLEQHIAICREIEAQREYMRKLHKEQDKGVDHQ